MRLHVAHAGYYPTRYSTVLCIPIRCTTTDYNDYSLLKQDNLYYLMYYLIGI